MAADLRAAARQIARKYGIDPGIFVRQIQQESGFNPHAVSGAGAKGIAQFIDATARSYGVNVNDPISSLDGAARYMRDNLKRYGSYERALSAYNSGKPDAYKDPNFAKGETYNYVRTIVGGHSPTTQNNAGGSRKVTTTTTIPGMSSPGFRLPGGSGQNLQISGPVFDEKAYEDAKRNFIVGQMIAKRNPNSFLLRSGLFSTVEPSRDAFMAEKTTTVRIPGLGGVNIPASKVPGIDVTSSHTVRDGGLSVVGRRGKVAIAATANRPGVHIKPTVTSFVSQIAGIAGRPLTIGTGTNHNQFVVGTNRQSDHWTGDAADIPAAGSALTRLGQQALIAAGMSPAKARKQTGGVFNLYRGGRRIQILFNTNVGGNHYNHLHVGVR